MSRDYTYRLPPVSVYDVGRYENWLADQSAQGLFFHAAKEKRPLSGLDLGLLGGSALIRFEKGAPERRRYRLEPARMDAGDPPMEEQELYEESGWRFAGSLRGLFWVFEAPDRAGIPEPHTDPAALGELYERVSDKLKPGKLFAPWLPCILLYLIDIFLIPRDSLMAFLTGTTSCFAGLLLYLLAQHWILFRHHYKPMRRLREQLAHGEAIDHNEPYRREARAYRLQNTVVLTFAAALIAAQFYSVSAYRRVELSAAENLPVALLSELEGSGFAYEETEWFQNRPYPNYVQYAWSILTPGQLSVSQNGMVGGGSSALQTEYYRVRFAALAGPLFDSVLKNFLRERLRYDPSGELALRSLRAGERAGFEQAVLLRQRGTETLIARRGHAVVCMSYNGPQELTAFLPQLAAALEG